MTYTDNFKSKAVGVGRKRNATERNNHYALAASSLDMVDPRYVELESEIWRAYQNDKHNYDRKGEIEKAYYGKATHKRRWSTEGDEKVGAQKYHESIRDAFNKLAPYQCCMQSNKGIDIN